MQDEPKSAPVDRTRAIVEAAEKLAKALKVDGAVKHPCDAELLPERTQALVADLARALALPAPKWTREPPKEPGDYYWRSNFAQVQPVRVQHGFGSRSDASGRTIHVPGLIGYTTGSEEWSLVDDFGGEWWPVPIELPPS